MNCLETRRMLMADPASSHQALASHLAECKSCRQFSLELARQEAVLRIAVEIAVPEHLEERILLQTQLNAHQWHWRKRALNLFGGMMRPLPAFAGMATLLLALTAWLMPPFSAPSVTWVEVALAHVIHEKDALARKGVIPQAELTAALKDYGLSINRDLGTLRFMERCAMPGGQGVHAVIDMPGAGKVTLLLPPIGTPGSHGVARDGGFLAEMMQIGGVSLAVVTESQGTDDSAARQLRAALVSGKV
jgi:hypothetical protein